MNKILLAAAIGSASLSFNASALEIIGGPSASDNGYQIAHQKSRYQQGINVLDLTNRDGIVSTVNYGVKKLGGYGRMTDLAKSGDPVASFYKGVNVLFGISEKIDVNESIRLSTVAYVDGEENGAEKREAALLLSDIYSGYREIEKHSGQLYAVSTSQREMAQSLIYESAINGHPVAEKRLAEHYMAGSNGFEKDNDLALYWLSRSAGKGDAGAVKILTDMSAEISEAHNYLVSKKELAKSQAQSLVDIANQYYYGKGVGQDKIRAINILKEAVNVGLVDANEQLREWLGH